MAFGNATFSDAGSAVNDLFSSQANATGLRIKSQGIRLQAEGNRVEAGNYDLASTLAKQNEQFTEQSTAVKQLQADRQIELGIGQETADIAGAGFGKSGTALDLLRSSAQQGALQKAVLGQQGLITEAGYQEQAQSFTNMAGYARYAAGQEDSIASQTDRLADTTARNGLISAGIKGIAAAATLFTGGAAAPLSAAALGTLNATDPGDI